MSNSSIIKKIASRVVSREIKFENLAPEFQTEYVIRQAIAASINMNEYITEEMLNKREFVRTILCRSGNDVSMLSASNPMHFDEFIKFLNYSKYKDLRDRTTETDYKFVELNPNNLQYVPAESQTKEMHRLVAFSTANLTAMHNPDHETLIMGLAHSPSRLFSVISKGWMDYDFIVEFGLRKDLFLSYNDDSRVFSVINKYISNRAFNENMSDELVYMALINVIDNDIAVEKYNFPDVVI